MRHGPHGSAHTCDPSTRKAEAGDIVLSSGATGKDTISRQRTLVGKVDTYLSPGVLVNFIST